MSLLNFLKRAKEVTFDNQNTTLTAKNVQDAIDQICEHLDLVPSPMCSITVTNEGKSSFSFTYYDSTKTKQTKTIGVGASNTYEVYKATEMTASVRSTCILETTNIDIISEDPIGNNTLYTMLAPAKGGTSGSIVVTE